MQNSDAAPGFQDCQTAFVAAPVRPSRDFGDFLVGCGLLDRAQALRFAADTRRNDVSLARVVLAHGAMDPLILAEAQAAHLGLPRADLSRAPPDPALMQDTDPRFWLSQAAIPWQRSGDDLRIATARPEDFAQLRAALPAALQTATAAVVTEAEVQACLAATYRTGLTAGAATRVPGDESCRSWGARPRRRAGLLMLAGVILLALVVLAPTMILTVLVGWAMVTLAITGLHRVTAAVAHLTRPDPPPDAAVTLTHLLDRRPAISMLVPLFREPEIAAHLIARIAELTYPKPLLDVIIVLEEIDTLTRDALAQTTLPAWMRVVVVPDGLPRTKPRAMNYALDFCRGDVIGIWDAEDAPDPDQLDRVADGFRTAAPDVVCLQGVLDYYNPRQNWLARCFTVEYATWFRLILPGMARLGLAIPLGGTTLFFRRAALEKLGGWDAHNVTEDADLGFRMARHGMRTAMLDTTTREEANCRAWPWVKQRSRWLKGYMVTWIVHMRAPRRLWRELGTWKFIGMQAHFVAALSQIMLAPLLWSFWLVVLGLPHPMDAVMSRDMMQATGSMFIAIEALTVATGVIAVSGRAHRHLQPWVPTLHLYWPLGTIAIYKALWELIHNPFYWDKTSHGKSQGAAQEAAQGAGQGAGQAAPQRFAQPALAAAPSVHPLQGAGIQFQPGDERL